VTDRGCGKGKKGKVRRVSISIARQVLRTGGGGLKCRNLKANGSFGKLGSCHTFVYLTARLRGTAWRFTTKRPIPPGRYRIRVKSIDSAGNRERPGKRTNTRRITLR
jgi:hypothetical protein